MNSRWFRKSAADVTVVFVHGINSDENAFRSESAFWPQLIVDDPAFARLGVYIFEYRSKVTAANYTLGDAVDYLREMLQLDRVIEQKQLIFVCHSMGGNLVRRYLVMQSLDLTRRQIKCGVFLIASPSTGSHYANLFSALRRQYHMQLESLVASQKNLWLNDLDKDFKNLIADAPFNIIGRELVEDLPIVGHILFPRTQVVPPQSAARYFGEPLKIPGSTHFTIAAPTGPEDLRHRVLKNWIETHFVPQPEDAQKERTFLTSAASFLAAIDENHTEDAWNLLDEAAQTNVVSSYEEFLALHQTARNELGKLVSRRLVGTTQFADPPGGVKGTYKGLNYIAEFTHGGRRLETVILRAAWGGNWTAFSYTVSAMSVSEGGRPMQAGP